MSFDSDAFEAEEHLNKESWWKNLLKRFHPADPYERLQELSLAIEVYPESVSSYVLRGEIYLQQGQYFLAETDFLKALEVAARQIETGNWGLVAQAMQDRAEKGLIRAREQISEAK